MHMNIQKLYSDIVIIIQSSRVQKEICYLWSMQGGNCPKLLNMI